MVNFRFYLLIVFVLSLSSFFQGCGSPEPSNKKTNIPPLVDKKGEKTIVYGNVNNYEQNTIYLYHPQYKDTALLNLNGSFEFQFKLNKAAYFNLNTPSKSLQLFITPGDSLKINFSAHDIFNTVTFSGNGALANNYLKSKYHLMLDQAIPLVHLYDQPVDPFRHVVDSFYVVQKIHLENFAKKNPGLSRAFVDSEKLALTYDRATKLMEYPKSSPYAHEIKPGYFKFIDKLNINDSTLLHRFEFKTFLKAFIEYYASEKLKASKNENYSPVDYTLAKMQTIVQKIKSPAIKNQWLFNVLDQHIKYYGYKNTEMLFKVYGLQNTNPWLKNKLQEPFEKYQQLKSNKNVSGIEIITETGHVTTLGQFKDQYIYIDVWATWCLPCRKEAPYFKALKEKFSHKKIAFISISVDDKKTDWKEYLAAKNMHDNQYWVSNKNLFFNEFMIKTIPHFILINPQGEIEQPIAPRPSEENHQWLSNLPDKPAS